MKRGRREKALRVLKHIRQSTEGQVEEEYKEILSSAEEGTEGGILQVLKILLSGKMVRRSVNL